MKYSELRGHGSKHYFQFNQSLILECSFLFGTIVPKYLKFATFSMQLLTVYIMILFFGLVTRSQHALFTCRQFSVLAPDRVCPVVVPFKSSVAKQSWNVVVIKRITDRSEI
jgi:hypothetical protein